MKEFKWKNRFINQEKKSEYINKYELLLLMLKIKCHNTQKLEENIASLEIQDFSVYEEFLIKHVLPESKKIKVQSKLLHNQPLFKDLIESIEVDTPLSINIKSKRQMFLKFSKYVNLKDLATENKIYNFFIIGLFTIPVFLMAWNFNHIFFDIAILNFLEVSISYILYRTFRGRSKSFYLNILRINSELCLIELQKILEELVILLKVSQDPYKDDSFEDSYEKFKNMFSVPENFLDICIKENIIDENNIVNSKYNHFMIQYLKINRNEKFRNERFDWQLINHVIIFDIAKNRRSEFLDETFKKNLKTGEYKHLEGKKFQKFLTLFV
ncbi:MAG: hypothetical protein J5527_14745 [Treponema sp.]|nr:hypothetical protein [Treponema sp.]